MIHWDCAQFFCFSCCTLERKSSIREIMLFRGYTPDGQVLVFMLDVDDISQWKKSFLDFLPHPSHFLALSILFFS